MTHRFEMTHQDCHATFEPCKAQTLLGAKREATAGFGDAPSVMIRDLRLPESDQVIAMRVFGDWVTFESMYHRYGVSE